MKKMNEKQNTPGSPNGLGKLKKIKGHLLLAALSSSWWLLSMDAGDTESTCLSVFEFSSILPRWDMGGEEEGDPGDPEKESKL